MSYLNDFQKLESASQKYLFFDWNIKFTPTISKLENCIWQTSNITAFSIKAQ